MGEVLYHFSEDPTIDVFVPHVPRTNPSQRPSVWAIDDDHAPLYWFPRDCPRVTVWGRDHEELSALRSAFVTSAERVHAIEAAWLGRMRQATLYRYTFDRASFLPWEDASGQWVSDVPVRPIGIAPVGDLLDAHVARGIDLRLVPSLWPLHDLALSGTWDFSIVRMANAGPRGVCARQ